MPINPEELAGITKKIIDVAEHPAAAEKIVTNAVEKGQSVLGKGWDILKKGAKTATVGGTGAAGGAAVSSLLHSNSSNNDNSDDTDSAASIANNPNLDVASLRGETEKGAVLTPTTDIADNIAESITPVDVENLRGSAEPESNIGENVSSSKIDRIISILNNISSSNRSIASTLNRGFRSMHEEASNERKSQQHRRQVENIEGSSRNSGGFLGNIMEHPISSGLKAIVGGTLATGIIGGGFAAWKHFKGKENKEVTPNERIGNKDDAISEAKAVYGNKNWALSFVKDTEDRLEKMPGSRGGGTEAENKLEQAENIYLAIKNAFDKAPKTDQDAIIAAIAELLKIEPSWVKKAIDGANSFTESKIKVAGLAVNDTVTDSTNQLLSGVYKAEGLIGGGFLSHVASPLLSRLGAKKLAEAAQRKGNEIVDSHMERAKDAEEGMTMARDNSTSLHSHLEALNNQGMFRGAYATSYGAAAMLGAGKGKFALAFGGLEGTSAFLGNSKNVLSNMAGDYGMMVQQGENQGKEDNRPLSEKEKEAVDFFVGKGWTKEQSIGIVSNFVHESQLKTDAIGDGGEAYGIAQWHPDRQEAFKNKYGKSIKGSSFQEQLAFANWELNNTFSSAGDKLRNTTTSADAAAVVTKNFEKPRDKIGQSAIRAATAMKMERSLDSLSATSAVKTVQAPSEPVDTRVADNGRPSDGSPIYVNGGSSINNQTNIEATSAMPDPRLYVHVIPPG